MLSEDTASAYSIGCCLTYRRRITKGDGKVSLLEWLAIAEGRKNNQCMQACVVNPLKREWLLVELPLTSLLLDLVTWDSISSTRIPLKGSHNRLLAYL
ncbi:hypothetical protein QYF36_004021 [Acer negundo]|nr:hypothetical protein QYF36_004021 [Acer negundo]